MGFLSKVFFYVPVCFFIIHGAAYMSVPSQIEALAVGLDVSELGNYYGKDIFLLDSLFRFSGAYELLVGLACLVMGDSKMGILLAAIHQMIMCTSIGAEADVMIEAGKTPGFMQMTDVHIEALKTGKLLTSAICVMLLIAVSFENAKKTEEPRRTSMLASFVLKVCSIILVCEGMAVLTFPEEATAFFTHFLLDKQAEFTPIGAATALLVMKLLGGAGLVLGLFLSLLKPTSMALWLGILLTVASAAIQVLCMGDVTKIDVTKLSHHRQIGLAMCSGYVVIFFVCLLTIPSKAAAAMKKQKKL